MAPAKPARETHWPLGSMKIVATLLAVLLFSALVVSAGHELTFYPSYYPQEVTVRFVTPATAAALLRKNALHAYVGADPFAGGAAPAETRWVDSLRGWVVLTFPRAGGAFAEPEARCAAAAQLARTLTQGSARSLDVMRAALDVRDLAAVSRAARQLRGVAEALGEDALHKAADDLALAAEQANVAASEHALALVATEHAVTLRRWRERET
jgi:hypothetical protein